MQIVKEIYKLFANSPIPKKKIVQTTLSVVNALPHQLSKRETQWGKCTVSGKIFPLLGITISPDPLVQGQNAVFNISGDFEAGATDRLGVGFFKDLEHPPLYGFPTAVCGDEGLPNCPIKPFKFVYKITVPKISLNPYFIAVVLGDTSSQTILACAVTQVGGGSEESYPIASYPIASYPIASYPIAE
ncbi:hypothetical protein Glove_259g41 [Diversispora epigaea]|uniref:MD-2-related lipid-recognition domain-containing protein n=1 Tax=Diversispora epigaea TaxID=1348612 RepID=A0A397IEZ4_9GLOM|nr:hypothetical protein Glove_259g41 [Diversispora epigaea]